MSLGAQGPGGCAPEGRNVNLASSGQGTAVPWCSLALAACSHARLWEQHCQAAEGA